MQEIISEMVTKIAGSVAEAIAIALIVLVIFASIFVLFFITMCINFVLLKINDKKKKSTKTNIILIKISAAVQLFIILVYLIVRILGQ